MHFSPGAYNIVPAEVKVALEFRAVGSKTLDNLEAVLLEQAQLDAERYGLGLKIETLGKHRPSQMSVLAQHAITQTSDHLGLKNIPLASFAGHDAQSLASLCPTGMIFVPSVNGISHSPDEFIEWSYCVNGANTLMHAVLKMVEMI